MVHVTVGSGAGSGHAMPPQAENWNQTGPVSVVTYTNCESVDLYVNATKVGTKNLSSFPNNNIMQWDNVPWQSGVIKAIGMNGGKQVAIDSIKTVGAPAKIVLKPDQTTLYADGEDVSSVEVDVADADGNLVYTAANQISFTLSGAGRSLGIASGDWGSSEPFKGTSRKAYFGKVLIVVQSTTVPGTMTLAVSAPGLTGANLTLTSGQVKTENPAAPSTSAFRATAGSLTCGQNPGSKIIRVDYRVDVPGVVSFSAVSASGRSLNFFTNKYHSVGTYSMEINAKTMSGLYFMVLKANTTTLIRKSIVVH
jgi:hypothetical protein